MDFAGFVQGIDFSKGARVTFIDGLGGKLRTGLKDVEKEILEAVKRQTEGGEGRVLVVLDGVDFLVAGIGTQVEEVMDMVQEVKDVCCFWIFHLIVSKKTVFKED